MMRRECCKTAVWEMKLKGSGSASLRCAGVYQCAYEPTYTVVDYDRCFFLAHQQPLSH